MNLLTTVENFDVIKSVLHNAFLKKTIDIQNKYDDDIRQVIQFINSKIQNIDENNIQSINKKVLDFSYNTIKDKTTKKKSPPPKNRASVESIFDGEISNETNPTNFIPLPSMSQNKTSMDDLLQTHESERKLLDPPRPVNTHENIKFSVDEPEIDQKEAYEEMLKKRGLSSNKNVSFENKSVHSEDDDDNIFNINDISKPPDDVINDVINDFNINGLTYNMSTPIDDISNNIIPHGDNRMPMGDSSLIDKRQNIDSLLGPVPRASSVNMSVKTHYITIDSRFRNLELYPDPSNFQIIFKNENIYSNVKSISLVHCSIPNINITPYLKFYIDELPSNFITIGSTDKYFSKLIGCDIYNSTNTFRNIKSVAEDVLFEETSSGIIDKMTCNIQTSLNEPLFHFNDKIYITKMENINGNIKIHSNNIDGKRLSNNDIIYIYNTTPSINDRRSFDKDIVISAMDIIEYKNENNQKLVKINANYFSYIQSNNMEVDAQSMLKNDKMEMEEKGYNFEELLNADTDYLYIRYKNTDSSIIYEDMIKIYNIIGEDLIIIKPDNYHNDIGYEIQEFKYARRKTEGYNVDDKKSLYYKGGHRVYEVGTNSFCIHSVEIGEMDEAFYIHHNNQINYTFKVVI